MTNPALGSKRVCVACSVRFYDLLRAPATCPKCGTEQPLDVPRVPRPARGMAAAARFRRAPVAAEAEPEAVEAEADEVEEEDEEDAADAAEDDALLIDDDEDKPAPEH